MSKKIEWDVCDRLRGRIQGAMRSGSRRRTGGEPDEPNVMRKRQQEVLNNG